jgi:hypothetical protein
MYAVIRQYTVDPTAVDEIVRRAEEGFVPLIRSASGFVGYSIGTAGDQVITVSTFQDRTQAEASVLQAAGWVKENLAALIPNPPTVFGGEVRVRQLKEGVQARYGVMRRYQADPGAVDEIVRRAEAGFVPLISQMPGFVGYSILDEGQGRLTTLSAFEDQAGAEESVRQAANWVKENLGALLPNPPEVTSVEIRVGVRK